jgi:hypothetical protein
MGTSSLKGRSIFIIIFLPLRGCPAARGFAGLTSGAQRSPCRNAPVLARLENSVHQLKARVCSLLHDHFEAHAKAIARARAICIPGSLCNPVSVGASALGRASRPAAHEHVAFVTGLWHSRFVKTNGCHAGRSRCPARDAGTDGAEGPRCPGTAAQVWHPPTLF